MKIYLTILVSILILKTSSGQIELHDHLSDIIVDIIKTPYTYEKFQKDSLEISESDEDSFIAIIRIENLKNAIQIPDDETIYPFGFPVTNPVIQFSLNNFSDSTFLGNEYSIEENDSVTFLLSEFSGSYEFWTKYKVDSFLSLDYEEKWIELDKDGILIIHQPAFNFDQTKAIFEYQFRCGRMCGYHFTCFLNKTNGKWEQEICETVIW